VYGNYYDSNGWRDFAPSLIRQVFGKVGYQTADFDLDLSYTFANNNLQGPQATPLAMLAVNQKLAYTWPDITENALNALSLRLSKVLTEDKILGGNVYWRNLKTTNTSSNVSDQFDGSNGGSACDGT